MLNRRQFLRTSLMTAAGALLAGVVGRFGVGEASAKSPGIPVNPEVPAATPYGPRVVTFPKMTWDATNATPIWVTHGRGFTDSGTHTVTADHRRRVAEATVNDCDDLFDDSIPETLVHPVDAEAHANARHAYDIAYREMVDHERQFIGLRPGTPAFSEAAQKSVELSEKALRAASRLPMARRFA